MWARGIFTVRVCGGIRYCASVSHEPCLFEVSSLFGTIFAMLDRQRCPNWRRAGRDEFNFL